MMAVALAFALAALAASFSSFVGGLARSDMYLFHGLKGLSVCEYVGPGK